MLIKWEVEIKQPRTRRKLFFPSRDADGRANVQETVANTQPQTKTEWPASENYLIS